MNKKFFTLLVALLTTISFGAFAQVTVGTAGTKYESNKVYLLETNATNYLAVDADGKLVTLPKATLTGAGFTYAELQNALWKVTATPGSTGTAVPTPATYVYTNVATGAIMALHSDKAVEMPGTLPNPANGANVLGGDIETWIASTNTVTPVKNYYYVTTKDDKVITMGANAAGEVVPVKYADLAALQTAAATANGVTNLATLQTALTNTLTAQTATTTALASVATAKTDAAAVATALAAASNDPTDPTVVAAVATADASAQAAQADLTTASTAANTASATTLKSSIDALKLLVDALQTATAAGVSASPLSTTETGAIAAKLALVDGEAGVATDAQNAVTAARNALNAAAASADAVINVTPKLAGGILPLTANDLNTYLGKTGEYDIATGKFLAKNDSFFKLNLDPKNTIANPFTGELQAYKASFTEAGNLITSGLTVAADGYKATDGDWVVLKNKDKKYLVVDTAYIYGTDQALNGLIETTVDDMYSTTATAKTNKRLADSYLFQFRYNASDNTVSVLSKAYISKPTEINTGTSDVWDSWEKADMSAATIANSVTINTGVSPNRNTTNYLTIAELGSGANYTSAYTFGDQKDLIIKLDATGTYVATRVPSGVYLLQVVSADAKKNGKFVKLSLDGVEEYVPQAVRQNFQHMPSAQWVIESTTTNAATITNREFSEPFGGGFNGKVTYKAGDKQFFFLGGDTLQYIAVTDTKDVKQGYKYVDNDNFAYLNNYVFRYLHELSMNNPVYAEKGTRQPLFVNGDNDATPSEFRLESAAIDTFGYTGNLKDVVALERSAYRVATYKAISFDKKKYYVTYDEDDKQYFLVESNKDGSAPATASVFYLKENNEVPATAEGAKADCYYTLLEANTYVGNFAIIDKTDASTLVYYHGLPYNFDYTTTMAAYTNGTFVLAGNDGKPLAFDKEEDAKAAYAEGVSETPIKIGNKFYAYVCGMCLDNAYLHGSTNFYASSKVSVDNNTLALVNGILEDNTEAEVNNSAFMIKPDDNILYRTLGAEEDEEDPLEQNIRIYRVNATAKEYLYEDANSVYSSEPKGPNTLPSDKRTSQINFLGVEGKGDNKLEEAVMTARYVRGTVMPQYLLMVNYKNTPASSASCPICDELPEPIPGCPHHDAKDGFSTARVLVSLQDSVDYSKRDASIFEWNGKTRLAFVDGMFTHGEKTGVKDSLLTIVRSAREAKYNVFPVKFTAKETPNEGKHQPVFFSFRLIEEGNKQFLMESAGEIGGKTANTWVKVQNGVPVLQTTSFSEAVNSEAELFDWEVTDDAAVANDNVELAKVSVAGDYGQVIIKGAAGKTVVISNVLGQAIATQTISEDNVTIQAPAGVVVVAVQGEKAVKALVK